MLPVCICKNLGGLLPTLILRQTQCSKIQKEIQNLMEERTTSWLMITRVRRFLGYSLTIIDATILESCQLSESKIVVRTVC
jgi:hypothetical protein